MAGVSRNDKELRGGTRMAPNLGKLQRRHPFHSAYACGGICVGMDPVYRARYIQKNTIYNLYIRTTIHSCGKIAVCQLCRKRQPVRNSYGGLDQYHAVPMSLQQFTSRFTKDSRR